MNNIRIVHSHLYSSDVFVRKNLINISNNLKWVITMHGDYNAINVNSLENREYFIRESILNFKNADYITYVADENLYVINENNLSLKNIKKINLGIKRNNLKEIDKNKSQFIFCMVARSNEAKGWVELINAFNRLNKQITNISLICVGPLEGILLELKNENLNDNIIFTGYTENPFEFISQADICLLPSWHESTPYSIIEYLSEAKPIIGSNVGEIRSMISDEKGEIAGIILDLKNGKVDEFELEKSMLEMFLNEKLRKGFSKVAKSAFAKFSMENCMREYIEIYESFLK